MTFQKGQSGNPAGRKRTADKHAGAVARAEKRIADRLPSLIDNMFILADGVYVEEITEDGTRNVYQRPPDRAANEYLINRVMGKPTERQEISGPAEGPIEVRGIDYRTGLAALAPGPVDDSGPPSEA